MQNFTECMGIFGRVQQDYKPALKSISVLFDNEPEAGTPEDDYPQVMVSLIELNEVKYFSGGVPGGE